MPQEVEVGGAESYSFWRWPEKIFFEKFHSTPFWCINSCEIMSQIISYVATRRLFLMKSIVMESSNI